MMQSNSVDPVAHTRLEMVFGNRVERCFSQRPNSLFALLENAVQQHPDGVSLVCGSQRLSWLQLDERVSQLAAGMRAVGIRAGDRVAMLLGNRSEFVVTLFAAARLGAIAVPMNIREQTPGLTYMLEHSGAQLLVHEPDLVDRLPAASAVQALRHRWQVGDEAPAKGSSAWNSHLRSDQTEVATVHEQDAAVILYTSGTTGRPKGAILTHLGIVHSSMHYALAMGLSSEDCTISAVPLSHVTGLVALVTTFAWCAGTLVIQGQFKAAEFLSLAVSERMTHSLMVPAMYKLCLMDPNFKPDLLNHWRIGGYGGAPMPVAVIEELARQLPDLELMNCYGSTETTSPATIMPRGDRLHPDSVGKPLHCVQICVMDDDGRELAANELGELWIKGPMVVPGYWNNPQASAESIVSGWWRSGDLGSMDDQGYVRVLDRKKDMINRGGFKIYSIEVENALYEHPAVQEAAVVAKPCPVLGERVHAWVSVRHPIDAQKLRDHCAQRLSDYKVPESYTLVETPLPRNANGKLLKREMRDLILNGEKP
jgi:acyl-CoA synthetase (AMP-forming)/AMP-acid ligase II